jgi:hypothetical protein
LLQTALDESNSGCGPATKAVQFAELFEAGLSASGGTQADVLSEDWFFWDSRGGHLSSLKDQQLEPIDGSL